mmetsp:Transcript_144536/g.254914  ORF Transcript_144536/g.254914 Transcript_144536/m.254914 type:complete len:476 (+) Transcript_144536:85-1512(+)
MSLFSGDNEIGNILQEAVKLKSAQMGQKRKTYETWPYFVQHTIFHSEKDDFKTWRHLPFDEKIEQAESIKDEGNKLYQDKKYADAVDKYEEAASLFHYCYSTDPGWRKNNRGIDDDVLVLVDDEGEDEDQKRQIRKLRLMCCLNLAQSKIKLAKFDEAIVAATVALELDPENVKALYRRAEARVRPSGSTAYDHDCAIKDLNKANEIDPKDKTVSSLLKTLREERRKQREKDKGTFEGMFERGEIYDKESMEEAEKQVKPSHRWEGLPSDNEMSQLRKRVEDVSDDDPLEKRIADAELLRDLYERNQKEDEAKKLNEQIQAAKKALKEQQDRRTGLDFTNPTPEMVADAQKYGLDLNDPLVQAELQRIEREGPGALEGVDENSSETSAPAPPPAVEVPLPEKPDYVPVPWMRYVLLVGIIILVLRLRDVISILSLLIKRSYEMLSKPKADPGEDGGSIFARAYQALFAGSDEVEF